MVLVSGSVVLLRFSLIYHGTGEKPRCYCHVSDKTNNLLMCCYIICMFCVTEIQNTDSFEVCILFCFGFCFCSMMSYYWVWFVVFAVHVFCFHLMASSTFRHTLFMSKVINCIYSPVFMVLDYLNSSIYIEITYDRELSFKSYLLSWQLLFVLYWEQRLIMLHIIFKISNISLCTYNLI